MDVMACEALDFIAAQPGIETTAIVSNKMNVEALIMCCLAAISLLFQAE